MPVSSSTHYTCPSASVLCQPASLLLSLQQLSPPATLTASSCACLSVRLTVAVLAEAMNFNFGLAKLGHGQCFMRFDDTNPEAEKLDYIEQILDNLQWLGHEPAKITYSSDYFPQLYELAVRLIKSGHAYVDHQTAAEIKASRDYKEGSKAASPWRDRPIEESLRLFDDMRKGKFDEGAATLRMRGDLSHPNPQMWDLVAYRIKYAEHPHVGSRWCIYPSYDYTHWSVLLALHCRHSSQRQHYWPLD